MNEEMKLFHLNNNWTLVRKPEGSRLANCKWVFKRKDGASGTNQQRFKARLVSNSFIQREGIDYNDVFYPVVKHISIMILLATIVELNLEVEQMDVKTTFLYGELNETINMKQSEGF